MDQDDWTEDAAAAAAADLSIANVADDSVEAGQDDAQPEDPALEASAFPSHDGFFEGRIVFAYGFDLKKTEILREHLDNNGAIFVEDAADLLRYSSEDVGRGYLVIPHDDKTDLTPLPGAAATMALVTNWWVERCLHAKCLIDHTENVLCRPFERLSINGFDGLTINSTGFIGIELLQVSKAAALMGAKYDEFLTTKASVLVCNTRNTPNPNPGKLRLATDRRIPAVRATWLWECLRTGELQPYDDHLLNVLPSLPSQPRSKPQQPHTAVPTVPLSEEEHSKMRKMKTKTAKLKSKPQSRHGPQQPRTLDLALSADPTPASTTDSSAHLHTDIDSTLDDDAGIDGVDGSSSYPRQDMNPSVNSPRRPSTSSSASSGKSPAASVLTATSKPTINEAYGLTKAAPTPALAKESTPAAEPAPEEKDYSSIMSNILAQRKTITKEDDTRKRRRKLGRAPSNPSASNDLSRPGESVVAETTLFQKDLGSEDKPREEKAAAYQPSQELGWDAPGAQETREKMIKAMGGTVEDSGGVEQRLGVIKDVVRGGGPARAAGRRKRDPGF